MNRSFHNSTAALVAGVCSTAARGTGGLAIAEPNAMKGEIGVPEPNRLPGRFPGAEPYIPVTRFRVRRNMKLSG